MAAMALTMAATLLDSGVPPDAIKLGGNPESLALYHEEKGRKVFRRFGIGQLAAALAWWSGENTATQVTLLAGRQDALPRTYTVETVLNRVAGDVFREGVPMAAARLLLRPTRVQITRPDGQARVFDPALDDLLAAPTWYAAGQELTEEEYL